MNDVLEAIEKEQGRFPWVFWLKISVRRDWFSYWWHIRGVNVLDCQVWIFRINMGMPWLDNYKISHYRDYGTLDGLKRTNQQNKQTRGAFLIGNNTAPA